MITDVWTINLLTGIIYIVVLAVATFIVLSRFKRLYKFVAILFLLIGSFYVYVFFGVIPVRTGSIEVMENNTKVIVGNYTVVVNQANNIFAFVVAPVLSIYLVALALETFLGLHIFDRLYENKPIYEEL